MLLSKDFDFLEFQSKDGRKMPDNLLPNLYELAKNLQVLRDFLNAAVFVNSGYRSPVHNLSVGGQPDSKHLEAMAADIRIQGFTPLEVYNAIEKLIKDGRMKQGGLGLYDGFVHYDTRGEIARWNFQSQKKKACPLCGGSLLV